MDTEDTSQTTPPVPTTINTTVIIILVVIIVVLLLFLLAVSVLLFTLCVRRVKSSSRKETGEGTESDDRDYEMMASHIEENSEREYDTIQEREVMDMKRNEAYCTGGKIVGGKDGQGLQM